MGKSLLLPTPKLRHNKMTSSPPNKVLVHISLAQVERIKERVSKFEFLPAKAEEVQHNSQLLSLSVVILSEAAATANALLNAIGAVLLQLATTNAASELKHALLPFTLCRSGKRRSERCQVAAISGRRLLPSRQQVQQGQQKRLLGHAHFGLELLVTDHN